MFVKALGTEVLRGAVVLPKGEEVNEWLAVNTVDFFNEVRYKPSQIVNPISILPDMRANLHFTSIIN